MFSFRVGLFVYLLTCSFLAFVDFDFDAENGQTAYKSAQMQMLYMSDAQKAVYMSDLGVLEQSGYMGGSSGRGLHGMEADDIHETANEIRSKHGAATVDFPSGSFFGSIVDFFIVPFALVQNN